MRRCGRDTNTADHDRNIAGERRCQEKASHDGCLRLSRGRRGTSHDISSLVGVAPIGIKMRRRGQRAKRANKNESRIDVQTV